MKYIELTANGMGNYINPRVYLDRLPSLADNLPHGAREFATDPGHYDFAGTRCTKDLAPEHLQTGTDEDGVWVELGLRHNCWKHDEDLTIRYHGVYQLTISAPGQRSDWTLLGPVILDEILPDGRGCTHEIACLGGSITVACQDLAASWREASCPERPANR